jgi:Domain of unknown function (DUF2017)
MGLLDPPGFRRNRHGEIWLHLPADDRTLLDSLLEQMRLLLAPDDDAAPGGAAPDPLAEFVGIDPTAVRPADPALARLFPDAYEDPLEADDFRRFTQRDLRARKLHDLDLAHDTLQRADPTRLTPEEQQAWLGALNDLRLTLGTRLGVTEDPVVLDGRDQGDPDTTMYLVYDWLTYHQDRLIRALAKSLR